MIESIKDQLLQIKALAERGVAGERETAARMLERLLTKHGLNLADLDGEKKETVCFVIQNTREKELLIQVASMIIKPQTCLRGYFKGRRAWIEMTLVEFKDTQAAFNHYKAEWKKEQKKMFVAFIHRHRIFPPATSEKHAPSMTRSEMEDLLRRMGSFGSQDWKRPAEQLAMGGCR